MSRGTPLSAGGSYSFTSSGKRGAVAVLKDGGIQEKVIRSAAFQKYIYNHHESWHKLATDRGFDLRVEDIVLVSGWIKTSGWELATHANRDSSHEFSLSLGASGIASANANASFQSHTRVKLLKRAGPNPATSNKDQCLFLQYYKCSNKGLGATTIVNPRNLKPSHIREEVPNGCFCSPFIGLMNWVRRCFGACCGGCCGVDSDDSSERVCPLHARRLHMSDKTLVVGKSCRRFACLYTRGDVMPMYALCPILTLASVFEGICCCHFPYRAI